MKHDDIHPILKSYLPIVKGLAETLGKNFEIVLHDLSDLESSVIAIENGHITNRTIGAPATDFLVEFIKKDQKANKNMELNYMTQTKEGKKLKSSTFLIRDGEDIIGALCINIDLTNIRIAQNFLEELIRIENEDQPVENFPEDANSYLNLMIEKALEEINKPITYFSKNDRLRIVSYLNEKNIFNIKGSVEILAKKLNCSRYSIYNYLTEIGAEASNT